jgi:hypothetical protein
MRRKSPEVLQTDGWLVAGVCFEERARLNPDYLGHLEWASIVATLDNRTTLPLHRGRVSQRQLQRFGSTYRPADRCLRPECGKFPPLQNTVTHRFPPRQRERISDLAKVQTNSVTREYCAPLLELSKATNRNDVAAMD